MHQVHRPPAGRRDRPGRHTGFFRVVAQLGHRLAVAAGHLDDDIERRVTEIIGKVGSDAETDPRLMFEAVEDVDGTCDGETVAEYQ